MLICSFSNFCDLLVVCLWGIKHKVSIWGNEEKKDDISTYSLMRNKNGLTGLALCIINVKYLLMHVFIFPYFILTTKLRSVLSPCDCPKRIRKEEKV